ncbi:MAG TPA: multicopper oxidase domain-containing protein, partial [Burkholderiales bacterium]|nr:multicopper oxidase domain-containing protein [Burkholderiales bacterium]
MQQHTRSPHARRRFIAGIAGLAAAPLLPLRGSALSASEPALVEAQLVAAPATAQLVPKEYPRTKVWAYNDSAPGPVLRARQGDRLRVRVENRLEEPTTVH